MRRFRVWMLAVLAGILAWAGPDTGYAEDIAGRIWTPDGERSFVAYVPPGKSRRLPVVIALHGAVMDGRGMQRTFALDEIAEREGFIAVYPDGRARRWNDGRRERWRQAGEPDDVDFLIRLARRLAEDGLADTRRLYLLGVSNGGMMAYRVACEAPGTFAAYAAVVANMPASLTDRCRPKTGVPMMIMNSTNDPLIPWGGGSLGFAGRFGRVVSTEQSLDFWRRNNGCDGERQTMPLPDRDRKDGSTVLAQQYNRCKSGAPVVLIAIEGGGHLPPGAEVRARFLVEGILGKANRDISAADVTWKFFRRFPQGTAGAASSTR